MTELKELRARLLEEIDRQPVVLRAPTGTGKSTLVPTWLAGRVLVVEPRRVACQSLAQRVANLLGVQLGTEVGYRVRDDESFQRDTRILFCTPGIVLRDVTWTRGFDVVILDEFHERRLDTDWLCAWLKCDRQRLVPNESRGTGLLVLSATLGGAELADYLNGVFLEAEARTFPIDIRYLGSAGDRPDSRRLEERVLQALELVSSLEGDVLCFLPGKAEITRVGATVAQHPLGRLWEVVELHGGLSLKDQSRAFRESNTRKLILSTNVAETSVTVPGVQIVIDSGLVRRTHFVHGRAHLALSEIAMDSATQRAGRAGRTAPGLCLRLWGPQSVLAESTPPELHRESLTPLLLWTAAAGLQLEDLTFLQAPKLAALDSAYQELLALGALRPELPKLHLTERGQRLCQLPVDAWYGALLVEAEHKGQLSLMCRTVALLSQPGIALPAPEPGSDATPCDLTALLNWYSSPGAKDASIKRRVLQDEIRLLHLFGLDRKASNAPTPTNSAITSILDTVLTANPGAAHVARRRKRETVWASSGSELSLARESYAQLAATAEAIIVLDSRAVGIGRERQLIATRASVVSLPRLLKAGLGEARVGRVQLNQGKLLATVERVLYGKVIGSQLEAVTGDAAREAVAHLFVRGRLFPEARRETELRLKRRQLATVLAQREAYRHWGLDSKDAPPSLEAWVAQRLQELGFESGEDLALLSAEDLLAEDLPAELLPSVESEFPLFVDLGDCRYAVDYDLERRQVLLRIVRGRRATAPQLAYLPRFKGFRVYAEVKGSIVPLRTHG